MCFKIGSVQLLDNMNFLGGATSLKLFLKAFKTSDTKGFSPYEWFDCPQKVKKSELSPYDAFFRKLRNVNALERTVQIIKNYLAAHWRLTKHSLEWSFPNHRLHAKRTTNICSIHGIMRTCAYLKTFYSGKTTKTLSQHSKQCKKGLLFITRKELTCWRLGVNFRIWHIFVSTNLPVPNSIHLLKPIKTCCKRFEKIWWVVLLSFSHVKL